MVNSTYESMKERIWTHGCHRIKLWHIFGHAFPPHSFSCAVYPLILSSFLSEPATRFTIAIPFQYFLVSFLPAPDVAVCRFVAKVGSTGVRKRTHSSTRVGKNSQQYRRSVRLSNVFRKGWAFIEFSQKTACHSIKCYNFYY